MMMITTEHSGDKGVCPATSHATSLSAMSHPGCCPERRRDAAAWRLFSAPLRCCLAFIFGPIKLLMYHMLISHIMQKKTNVHPRTHAEKPHVTKNGQGTFSPDELFSSSTKLDRSFTSVQILYGHFTTYYNSSCQNYLKHVRTGP
jgi:hypothetical protein